jgi:predicted hydrocarbon binding protein
MHGVILLEFHRFVEARHGAEFWKDAVREAGLSNPVFMPTQHYPDADLLALVSTVSRKVGTEPAPLLEDFGAHMVPALIALYSALIEAQWTLLDLLEHTEATIHRVVRIRVPGAAPPQLKSRRLSPTEVELLYASERKLCALALGIIKGFARVFEETVTVTEPECMRKGDPACRILVHSAGPKKR